MAESEGGGVPQGQKQGWSSFLKVRPFSPSHPADTRLASFLWSRADLAVVLVDRELLGRPLLADGAALHPLLDLAHRVLVLLGRAPANPRRAGQGEGCAEARAARP
jgi:hypothetical protein